ncbi:protein meiotic P26-like [Branchiostoma floridae x Branchiostoma belcheri]
MPKRKSSKSTNVSKSEGETNSDALLSKISGDFLECTICLEPYKDPKVLPCLHTFCEDCLRKFAAQDKVKNKFQCPTCRIETVLPKGGVASFKNNFFVQSLGDTVQAHRSLVSKEDDKVQCNVCEEEVASRGCVPCEEFLCDECASAHHRAKRTRSHEVISAVELREQLITKTGFLKSRSLPVCLKHEDEKMKFHCETCKCPICRDCTVLQHKDHKYGYLADTVGNVREEIKEKLDAAGQKMVECQDKATAVAKKQAELDTRSKKATDDIDAAAEEEIKYLTGLVRRKQSELKEKLASITASRSKQLSATADSVESTLDCLSSTMDISKKVVEHGSDFDILNVYSDVTSRLESLLAGPTPDIPDDISNVLFDPKTERKAVILGNIVGKEMQDEEEESRAEATFRFTVENFSKLNVQKLSPAIFIRNLPWKISVRPYYSQAISQLPPNKRLAVFLRCDANAKSLWSCRASAELRLISHKKNLRTVKETTIEQTFCNEKRTCWRWLSLSWHEVCDPQKGYIKDDKIILEAYVKADPPLGMKALTPVNMSSKEILDKDMKEEDMTQAKGTITFTVENFSNVKEMQYSNPVSIHNLPWILTVECCDNPDAQPPNNKSLSVYLLCDADSNNLWSCRASAKIQLIPQMEGVSIFKRKFRKQKVFYSEENSRGYQNFMPWHEVCDPAKGYIKDDKIILEAYVKADAPCILA